MTSGEQQGQSLTALAERDIEALMFTAEMYGVQLDQLAVVLGVSADRARGVAVRWRNLGLAESARLGPARPGPAVGLGHPARAARLRGAPVTAALPSGGQ